MSDFPIQSSQHLDSLLRVPEFKQTIADLVAVESAVLMDRMRNAVHNGDHIESMRLEERISQIEELPVLLQRYAELYSEHRE